jgi:hypothetical protein
MAPTLWSVQNVMVRGSFPTVNQLRRYYNAQLERENPLAATHYPRPDPLRPDYRVRREKALVHSGGKPVRELVRSTR